MFILTLLKSLSPVSVLVGAVIGGGVPAVTVFVRKQIASVKAKAASAANTVAAKVSASGPTVVAEVKSAVANVVSEVEKKL